MDYIGLTRWQSIGRDLSSLDRDSPQASQRRLVTPPQAPVPGSLTVEPKPSLGIDVTAEPTSTVPRTLHGPVSPTSPTSEYANAFSDLSDAELQRRKAEIAGRLCKILHLKATLAPPPAANSPHWGNVLYRTLRRLSKGFSTGYGIKFVLTILPLLLRSRGNPLRFIGSLRVAHFTAPIRHGLFLSSFLALFENIMSLTRGSRDLGRPGRSLLAGFLAGLSILLVPKSSRTDIALFAVVRAIEVLIRLAATKPGVPNIPHLDSIIFAISSAQIVWTWIFERDSLEAGYTGFLNNHASGRQNFALAYAHLAKGYNDIPSTAQEGLARGYPIFGQTSRPRSNQLKPAAASDSIADPVPPTVGPSVLPLDVVAGCNRYLATKRLPILTPDVLRSPERAMCHLFHPHHPNNCARGHLAYFPEALRTSLRTYLPVYIIPALLFRWRHLFKTPNKFFQNIASNTLRSTLFFSLYAVTAFGHACTLRNIAGLANRSTILTSSDGVEPRTTPHWMIWLGGLVGASSIFVEKPERRVELSLFAGAHALRALINTLVRRRLIPSHPIMATTLSFAVSTSILMYAFLCEPMLIRPSNFALLRFLFGSGGVRLRFPSTNDRKATSEWLSELQYFLADDAPEPTVPLSPSEPNQAKILATVTSQPTIVGSDSNASTTAPQIPSRFSLAAGERVLRSSQSFAHLSHAELQQQLALKERQLELQRAELEQQRQRSTLAPPISSHNLAVPSTSASHGNHSNDNRADRYMLKERSFRVLAPADPHIREEDENEKEEDEDEDECTMDADEVNTNPALPGPTNNTLVSGATHPTIHTPSLKSHQDR